MPIFSWKRQKPGVHVCNDGDDAAGGSVVRLAKNDWRVYAFGGGIANAVNLRAAKRVLESALSKASEKGVPVAQKRGPISPDEIDQVRSAIPDEVFDAFNEVIASHWDGRSAKFTQDEVVTAALVKLRQRFPNMTRERIYVERWVDVEPAYEAKGWRVDYDKPAYCESYPATFTFERKTR